MNKLEDIIVAKYHNYLVIKRKEQAQNEIRLFIQNANNQVSENEQSYSILFDRYKHDVGYSEAKETIKTRLIVRLLLVVKFKMTYSK